MVAIHPPFDVLSETEDDYYLAECRALVDQFLADHGLTLKKLLDLPEAQASALYREALDYAAWQIARIDAMVRLGSRDADIQLDEHPRHHHVDRLALWLHERAR